MYISIGKVQRLLKSDISIKSDMLNIDKSDILSLKEDIDNIDISIKEEIKELKKDIFRLNSKLLMSDEGFDEDKFKLIFASLDIINKHFFLKDQTYYSKHSLKIDKMVKEWENEGKNRRTLKEVLNDSIK